MSTQHQSMPHDAGDPRRELCSAPSYLISWRSNAGLALAKPGRQSASKLDSLFDVPNPGGARQSGQPQEWIDMSCYYSSWQPAASVDGLPAHRPQGFEFGSTSTASMNQRFDPPNLTDTSSHQQQCNSRPRVPTCNNFLDNFGASQLSNSTVYTDPASVMGPVKQEHSSVAPAKNQRNVPPFGTEQLRGE